LNWQRNAYASDTDDEHLTVAMKGVFFFEVLPRDSSMPDTEDSCLRNVSYVSPEDDIDYAGIYEALPDPGWHYVLDFMSGLRIRVGATETMLRTTD
jgi:hypothetical protein